MRPYKITNTEKNSKKVKEHSLPLKNKLRNTAAKEQLSHNNVRSVSLMANFHLMQIFIKSTHQMKFAYNHNAK